MNGPLNLGKECSVEYLLGAVSAGTDGSRQTLTEVNMQGYNACALILLVGTVTSTGTITVKAKGSDTSATYGSGSVGDMLTAAGAVASAVGATSNKTVVFDIIEPLNQYIRFDYIRETANVVILGAVVVKYNRGVSNPITPATGNIVTTVANPSLSAA